LIEFFDRVSDSAHSSNSPELFLAQFDRKLPPAAADRSHLNQQLNDVAKEEDFDVRQQEIESEAEVAVRAVAIREKCELEPLDSVPCFCRQ
jgi:hydrogenase maturation factor HypF (carbamoyltransferase family)